MKAGGLGGPHPPARGLPQKSSVWLRTTNSNLAEAQASGHVTCDSHWVILRVKRGAANNHAEKIDLNRVRLRQARAMVAEVLGNPQTQQGLMREVRGSPAPPLHRCGNRGGGVGRGEKTCCPNLAQTQES